MCKDWKKWLKLALGIIIVVVLVKAFLVTSCIIPSSGMENSLYKGERVLVNKWSYGLRTPFPSWFGYHRIGRQEVRKGDIVLFNDPSPAGRNKRLENRNLFISRCVGVPGDTLMLNKELLNVQGEILSPDAKSLYSYPSSQEDVVLALLDVTGIRDNSLLGYTPEGDYIRSFSHYEFYLLSQKADGAVHFTSMNSSLSDDVHPYEVPGKDISVKVYPWNVVLLCNTIRWHEGRRADVKRDTLLVDGRAVTSYRFSRNYYWMAANDPVNLYDSRLFGFVPEEYVIGKAWRIWFTSRKGRFFQRVQ